MARNNDLSLGFYYARDLVTDWILNSESKEQEQKRRAEVKKHPKEVVAKLIMEKNDNPVDLPDDLAIEVLEDSAARCYLVLPEFTDEPVPGWVL